MISTPYSAYHWLRGLGLSHEQAMGLTTSNDKYEYFMACVEDFIKARQQEKQNADHVQSNP